MVCMLLVLTIIRHIQVMILDIVCSFELYREVGINCTSFSIRVYINEFFIVILKILVKRFDILQLIKWIFFLPHYQFIYYD